MNPRSGRYKRSVDYGADFYSNENFQPSFSAIERSFDFTEDQRKRIEKNASFHFIFLANKSELPAYVNGERISSTIEKVSNTAQYSISVVEQPAADMEMKETLSKFRASFPEIDNNFSLFEKLEKQICKSLSDGVVTNRQCNDRVFLNIYIDDSVQELALLDKAAFQIAKSYENSQITLKFLASGLVFKQDSSENVLENLYAARQENRRADFKECDEILKALKNSLTISYRMETDPDLITKQYYFFLTTQTGFSILNECNMFQDNKIYMDRAWLPSPKSEDFHLQEDIHIEYLYAVLVESYNSRCMAEFKLYK